MKTSTHHRFYMQYMDGKGCRVFEEELLWRNPDAVGILVTVFQIKNLFVVATTKV